MTTDPTEAIRRARMIELNEEVQSRIQIEEQHGQAWDTQQLGAEFDVTGFLAPYVVVRRKSDGKKGSLEFTHSPRLYFNWQED